MSKTEKTSVQEVDLENLDDLFADAGSIMTSGEGDEPASDKKKSIFSRGNPDAAFIDNIDKNPNPAADLDNQGGEEGGEANEPNPGVNGEEDNPNPNPNQDNPDFLSQPGGSEEDNEGGAGDNLDSDDDKNKGGRPTALVSATKALMEKGILKPFQNDKGEDEPIDNYTAKDFQELLEANFEQQRTELEKSVPEQFYNSLPQELQDIYAYVANGGTDIKGILLDAANRHEVAEIDVTKPQGQKDAIRTYLYATGYGTPEEIEDEIFSLEDRGELEKKANQFKPKLDAMQEQIVQQRVAEQKAQATKRKEQSKKYVENVYGTLEKGELNGIALDENVQNMLYVGLTQSNYPSVSGKQTNMLGHLLEKYQWKEPRHDLVAEALWLLADPEGYRETVKNTVKKDVNTETVRKLKTEQQSGKSTGSHVQESNSEGAGRSVKKAGIPKPSRSFFKR